MYRFLNVTSFAPLIPVFTFLDVIEAAVFHAYIINVLVIIKSDDEYTEFALLASHVFEVYVAHGRGIAAIALFPVFVLQVDAQYGFAALADGDVAYKYILYQSAAAGTGLDADYAVQVGAVHAAVLNEQVTVAAGYFTADNDAAMTVFHEAAAHDDIFAGNVPLRPSWLRPDLMAMQSSPVSKVQFSISTFCRIPGRSRHYCNCCCRYRHSVRLRLSQNTG